MLQMVRPPWRLRPFESTAGRLAGIDLARCIALLGMFAVHVAPFAYLELGPGALGTTVFDGRASALFCVLAGVSLSLVSRSWIAKGRRPADLDRWMAARALAIIAIGLALTQLHQDVLPVLTTYGALFFIAIPARRLRGWQLPALAVLLALVAPVVSLEARRRLGLEPGNAGELPELAQLASPSGWQDFLVRLGLNGFYPVATWVPFLLAGMAIGRLRFNARAVKLALVGLGGTVMIAALAFGALLRSNLELVVAAGHRSGLVNDAVGVHDAERWLAWSYSGLGTISSGLQLIGTEPHGGAPLEILGSIGSAAMVIGLSLLVADLIPKAFRLPLTAAGGMTLTIYAAHVVVLRLLSGSSPSFGGTFSAPVTTPLFLELALGALLFATAWRLACGQGPLERIVAALGAFAVKHPTRSPGQILLAGPAAR